MFPNIFICDRAGMNVNFSIQTLLKKNFECFKVLFVMLIIIQISTARKIILCDVTYKSSN